MTRFVSFLGLGLAVGVIASNCAHGATIFESATLGPTGSTWQQALDGDVLGENLDSNTFSGVRFKLEQPMKLSQVGGSFVGPPSSSTSFFGAIIKLDGMNDFPDSDDLSTPDVLGHTLLAFPEPSDEVFGNLELSLSPGWYALVFGSGLFGANGAGGVLSNNADLGNPDYIGFLSGFGWGSRLPSKRFVINGTVVPEPGALVLLFSGLVFLTRIVPA